jgi:hypothetical protein
LLLPPPLYRGLIRQWSVFDNRADCFPSGAVTSLQIEDVGKRADAAYDAGNHATEKIAALASRPVIVTLAGQSIQQAEK